MKVLREIAQLVLNKKLKVERLTIEEASEVTKITSLVNKIIERIRELEHVFKDTNTLLVDLQDYVLDIYRYPDKTIVFILK